MSDLAAQGFTAWSTFAYAFEEHIGGRNSRLQVLGQLRYRDDERVVDEQNPARVAHQNSLLVAARIRLGSPDFNAFAEGGYLRIWNGLDGDGDAWRGAVGFERRMLRTFGWLLAPGNNLVLRRVRERVVRTRHLSVWLL